MTDKIEFYRNFSTGFLITKSSRWLLNTYQSQAHALNLTPIQMGVIFCLSLHNKQTLGQLCDTLVLAKSVGSKTLKRLCEKNWITPQAHPTDKRFVCYLLNQEKWQSIEKNFQKIDQTVGDKINNILTKKESKDLHKLLFKLLSERKDD